MSHTPTPYRVGKSYGGVVANIPENADDRRIEPDHMEAYGGYIVCESCTPEDARFIVEACNENQGLHDTIATLATTIERVHKERDALLVAVRTVGEVATSRKGTSEADEQAFRVIQRTAENILTERALAKDGE